MRETLEDEGWTQRDYGRLADLTRVEGTASGMFVRGNEGRLLLVSPDEEGIWTRASITTFRDGR